MKKLLLVSSIIAIIALAGCTIPLMNTPPVANFIYQPTTPAANTPVTFNASGSNDAEDGQNLAARWDFKSDGTWDIDYSHGKKVTDQVTFTFTAAGTYAVRLEVRDSQNATHSVAVNVTVTADQTPENTPPVANFLCETQAPQVNSPVTFNASTSTDAEDGQNLSARWDFNADNVWDIDYAAGKKITNLVTYTYTAAGTYNVKLEVKDLSGATAVKTISVVVADILTDFGTIQGFLVESRGGSGIGGAILTLSNGLELTTASDGSFCADVAPGLYQLTFTKPGYATSKVQDLSVEVGETIDLDLPLKEEFYESWSNDGPVIVVHDLPASSQASPISGDCYFTVEVQANLGVKQVDVRFTHGGLEPEYNYTDSSTIDLHFDTTWMPDGWNYIKISTYDANNNYTEVYKPVYLSSGLSQVQLPIPEIAELYAVTYGQSLQLMAERPERLARALTFRGNDLQQVLAIAKEANSTVITVLGWHYVSDDILGYKVYRSLGDESNYKYIGNAYFEGFIDTSAQLVPGQKVYYRITAFNGSSESVPSPSVYTIPLETFNVSLVAPAKDQIVTTANPVLTWQTNRLVGDFQVYYVVVQGVTDATPGLAEIVESQTSLTYAGYPLENGKEYEWDVVEALGFKEYTSTSYALSFSGADAGSLNGYYRFVTDF